MHGKRVLNLSEVLEHYRVHPEFLGLELSEPSAIGALGNQPAHIAAYRGESADLRVLIAAGADVNAEGDMGYRPLHNAVQGGSIESVRCLIELGADPELKNEWDETPLVVAEQLGQEEIAEELRRLKP